ncbi:MAG: class I SAM-dependent methyltransferase [Pseudomonadota bacterium]
MSVDRLDAAGVPWRKRARRAWMGVQTALGRPRGFFSPYRYAASVAPPAGYPALASPFARAFAASAKGAAGQGLAAPADVAAAIQTRRRALLALGGPAPRPRWGQSWYPGLDGAAAYAIVGASQPSRMIEVGSGHSTRFMAQALADAGRDDCAITCIDPAPRAALQGLGVRWERRLLTVDDVALFAGLEPGDVAFFDSSHLLWPGSDVDIILNGILPALAPGVLVHFHDVVLPDAYPQNWAWRGYTEQLALSGWIAGGGARILWSSHYARHHAGWAEEGVLAEIPRDPAAPETALWLIRA